MNKNNNKISPVLNFIILTLLLISPHFLAVIGFSTLFLALRSRDIHEEIFQVFAYIGNLPTIFSFIIPSLFILLYSVPIIKLSIKREEIKISDKLKARVLNFPIFSAFLGFTGWIVIMIFFFMAIFINDIDISFQAMMRYSLDNLLAGIFVFVFTFYVLESYFRKFFIPIVFPDNKLSNTENAFIPHISGKFAIYYIAVSFFPLFMFYSFTIASNVEFIDRISIFYIIILMLTSFLTHMIISSYKKPLLKMIEATKRISNSDYDVNIDIVSNDEVGNLGEAINSMAKGLKEKELIKETFGKVVDPRIRDHLLEGNIELGGKLQHGVIMFTDIKEFTPKSEEMDPEKIVFWLNKYFDKMSACVEKNNGIVNKFIGDSIMAIFGIPLETKNPELSAIKAAIEMKEKESEINLEFEKFNLPKIEGRIGIHSGKVLAGNIGNNSRMEYTVIGDAVNIASRIEQSCKNTNYDILFSKYIADRIEENYKSESIGFISLKGKSSDFELFCLKDFETK